jgi:hypothetical protein
MLKLCLSTGFFWQFLRGLFGMPKRFYGVQSDCESIVLAGDAYFQALVEKGLNYLV